MELKGSRTEANLLSAYTSEAMNHDRYSIFHYKAQEEGMAQIAELFKYTADNEREHAEMWYKELHGGSVPSTLDNLKEAINLERYEYSELYRNYAEEARKEGFDEIAALFDRVASVEEEHEKRFCKLRDNVENDEVFARNSEVLWECRKCGTVLNQKDAPMTCPTCSHPQSEFQLKAHNY